MCLPAAAFVALGATASTASTLATVGSIASVLGTGVSAIGSIKQGQASAASANYNAAVQTNNAAIAQQNSTWALQEGNAAVEAQNLKNRAEMGSLQANQAASGVDVNSGSAVDVRSSAAETGELNAINIRSNAARKAYGYQTDAASFEGQSGLDTSEAKNDTAAGEIGAGSTLLGGLGSASMNYAGYLNKNSINGSNDITASPPSGSSGLLSG